MHVFAFKLEVCFASELASASLGEGVWTGASDRHHTTTDTTHTQQLPTGPADASRHAAIHEVNLKHYLRIYGLPVACAPQNA